MKATIVAIGDEILIGQVVNTNAAFIAGRLSSAGIFVSGMAAAADDRASIVKVLKEAIAEADVCIATGGLGPTRDDVTREALCELFGDTLVPDAAVLERIRETARRRNVALTKAAEAQALVPATARIIPNARGTAPGLLFEREGKICVALPGVPYEMEEMVDVSVVPLLVSRLTGPVVAHRTIQTTGVSESALAETLGDPGELLCGAQLAFLPSPQGVRLRVTAADSAREAAIRKLDEVEGRIRARAGDAVFGTGEDPIERVVGRMLAERRTTLAVAESCTGGLVSDRITDVPGSSAYFIASVVAYADAAKTRALGVPPGLLKSAGAVSAGVAEAMAAGVRTAAGAEIGLSTTGIAGPSGGSAEKPVGLVWIGLADPAGVVSARFVFGPDRRRIKERAAQAALNLLRKRLLGLP